MKLIGNIKNYFFKKFEAIRYGPFEKIFGIKNSQHVLSYPKIKRNWSKSTFFKIVGGLKMENGLFDSILSAETKKLEIAKGELKNEYREKLMVRSDLR